MITNIQCRPVPSIWTGAVVVEPPAGNFNADMDTILSDDTTHTADET